MTKLLRQKTRRDQRGITAVEMVTTVMVLGIVLAALGATLGSAQRTSALADSEAASVDTARATAYQVQRDIRGATAVDATSCSPVGYCLQTYVQSPNGTLDRVRYRATQSSPPSGPTTLYRDSGCSATYTACTISKSLITNLQNQAQGKPLFSCVNQFTLPRIDISLMVSPLSSSASGLLLMQSAARPRNVSSAFCS
ncbi:MAG: hypothetical protein NVSMB57_01200 [Actinomycetota bacterium]